MRLRFFLEQRESGLVEEGDYFFAGGRPDINPTGSDVHFERNLGEIAQSRSRRTQDGQIRSLGIDL
jgi:hypothetical protein